VTPAIALVRRSPRSLQARKCRRGTSFFVRAYRETGVGLFTVNGSNGTNVPSLFTVNGSNGTNVPSDAKGSHSFGSASGGGGGGGLRIARGAHDTDTIV